MAEISTGGRVSVFISYSSNDHRVAQEVSEALEAAGLPTFFGGRNVRGGRNYAAEIVRAISACDVVVVLLSAASTASPHVQREVSLAVDERRALLPIALPGTSYPTGFSTSWIYWLSPVHVATYRGTDAVLTQVRALLERAARPRRQFVASERARTMRRPLVPSRPRVAANPSSLLRADARLPALLGREEELARLQEWCLRPGDFDSRIVTAGAGEGKTRLAHELGHEMTARGWRIDFVDDEQHGSDVAGRLEAAPTLLVIDRAEARGDQVFELLDELMVTGVPDIVRLLLLARSAGDWWRALLARDANVLDLLSGAAVQPLKSLTADRGMVEALYGAAQRRFTAELGSSLASTSQTAPAPYKTYTSALEVLEDALDTALGGEVADSSSRVGLLLHERRYLTAAAVADGIAAVDDVELERIAAALSLYGAASEEEAVQLIHDCQPEQEGIVLRRIARLFRRLYPGASWYVAGMRPDSLAEDLIAEVAEDIGRLPGAPGGVVSGAHTVDQRRRALSVLARGAYRRPVLAAALADTMEHADDRLLRDAIVVACQVENPDQLTLAVTESVLRRDVIDVEGMLDAIPNDTVALADVAAQLSRRAMQALADRGVANEKDADLAMACSNRFSDAGWANDAAEAARLAVDLLEPHRARGIQARALGRALTNLSNRLWELGRLQESVLPACDAVDVLAAETVVVQPEEIAAARNNLAFRMAERGDLDTAFAEATAAMDMCTSANAADTRAAERTRGATLNNLACIALGLGKQVDALRHGMACVGLRRDQAVRTRDQYLPFLARALSNAAPAAEACADPALADRLIAEARFLHELTAPRAPIFAFERAESTLLEAFIHLNREEWVEASELANAARDQLVSIGAELGDLRGRLASAAGEVIRLASDEVGTPITAVASGLVAGVNLPMLLEYRDL